MNKTPNINRMKKTKLFITVILVLALALPMNTALVFGKTDDSKATSKPVAAKAANNSAKWMSSISGEGVLSMIRSQGVTVTFKVSANSLADAQSIVDNGEFYLYRDKGCMPEEIYPYQFVARGPVTNTATTRGRLPDQKNGNPWTLSDWTRHNTNGQLNTGTKLFSNINAVASNYAGGYADVTLKFDATTLYGTTNLVASGAQRESFHDMQGDYKFEFRDSSDDIQAQTTVRYTGYESFRTMPEIARELVQAESFINNSDSDMYAEVRSMGESTSGLDMPYIVVTKDKKDIADYEEFMELSETNPKALIEKINNGWSDYKVPIMYSNIHSDEFNAVDSIVNFLWDVAKNDKINYKTIKDYNAAGKARYEAERNGAHNGRVYTMPESFKTLPPEKQPTGIGFVTGNSSWSSTSLDLNKYYDMQNTTLDVDSMLDDLILIIVPEENVDGRTWSERHGYGGYDLNRDNLFQAQNETQNMTKMIASWNPMVFWEQHGFVGTFQIEPCSPPHEPNYEYDLMAQNNIKIGEAYGNGAISNNTVRNSFKMPIRDYLYASNASNEPTYDVWDDDSTAYTPEYAMLHGTIGYTVEVPSCTEEENTALEHGLLNNAKYVADHKDDIFVNQLKMWDRGLNNVDAKEVDPWYEDINGNAGAEADIMRPKYAENDNFFPEYYVIPNDNDNQKNMEAASAMQKWLLDSDVRLKTLNEDVTMKDADGKEQKLAKGSIVVDMHQAKRNVANAALSKGQKLENWGTTLYSEPVTWFSSLRGFDMQVITKVGALDDKLTAIDEHQKPKSGSVDNDPYTIIMNSGDQNVKAINDLLYAGKEVGLITEGDMKGHYITTTADYDSIKKKYIVNATSSAVNLTAKVIEPAEVFLIGRPAEFKQSNGMQYGSKDQPRVAAGSWNYYDRTLRDQLGFRVSYTNPENADVIMGAGSAAAYSNLILDGTPYIGWTSSATNGIRSTLTAAAGTDMSSIAVTSRSGDASFYVDYPTDSLVTANRKYYDNNEFYNYGTSYFSTLPAEMDVLVQSTDDDHIAGSLRGQYADDLKNRPMMVQYKDDDVSISLFAGYVSWKQHQRDDNTLFTSALFEAMADKSGKVFNPTIETKDAVIVEAPQATEIGLGSTLADSVLYDGVVKAGDSDVDGKFTWTDPTIEPKELGEFEADVTFTPINKIYKPVTGKAKVNVVKTDDPDIGKIDIAYTHIGAVADQTYTGSAKKPALKVTIGTSEGVKTLVEGTDFEAVHSDNVAIGKAKVTLTGKGEYKGTKNGTYKVVPKNTSKLKVKAGKKKMKISWSAVSGITKYQVRYKRSTKSKWVTKTLSASKKSLLVKKLKAGKKYNVQIRTYKTVKGENFYSAWSKTKTSKKIKKSK